MGMEVVGLGAWCDFVTEDEFRYQLDVQASFAAEIEEVVDQFRRGVSFRVAGFATLADGRRLTLHEERGFTLGQSAAIDPWDHLTPDLGGAGG